MSCQFVPFHSAAAKKNWAITTIWRQIDGDGDSRGRSQPDDYYEKQMTIEQRFETTSND